MFTYCEESKLDHTRGNASSSPLPAHLYHIMVLKVYGIYNL